MNFFNLLLKALVISLFQLSVFSQDTIEGKMLFTKANSDIAFDQIQEIASSFANKYEANGSIEKYKVVLRLCSSESFETALAKSALRFPTILEVFAAVGYSNENVIVLKSSSCTSIYKSIVSTELWATIDSNQLPSYSEKYNSNQISFEIISESIYRFNGNRDYIKNTLKLAKTLKSDKSAKGIIYVIYNRNINETIPILKEISKLLIKNGVDKSSLIIHRTKREKATSINYINYPPKKKRNYPAFYLVKFNE